MPQLVAALAAGRIRVYDELAAQVRRIVDAGLRPTHLDTHKHTHLAPPVLDAVARLAEEFGIRWVRRPFDFPLHALRGGVPRAQAVDQRRAGVAAPPVPPRSRRGTGAARRTISRASRLPAASARRSWWN